LARASGSATSRSQTSGTRPNAGPASLGSSEALDVVVQALREDLALARVGERLAQILGGVRVTEDLDAFRIGDTERREVDGDWLAVQFFGHAAFVGVIALRSLGSRGRTDLSPGTQTTRTGRAAGGNEINELASPLELIGSGGRCRLERQPRLVRLDVVLRVGLLDTASAEEETRAEQRGRHGCGALREQLPLRQWLRSAGRTTPSRPPIFDTVRIWNALLQSLPPLREVSLRRQG
jgi:hypothetical protein